MTPVKTKGKYDAGFKLRVIHFAERFSNRAAGSKFGLNESTIRGWRKVKNSTSAAPLQQSCHGDDFKLAHGVAPVFAAATPKSPPTPVVAKEFSYTPERQASPGRDVASDAFLYRKKQVRERATSSSRRSTTPSPQTFLKTHRRPKQRVFVGRSEYSNFPEVAIPFTVIAEKAIRALYRGPEVVTTSASRMTNREAFAGLLGLRPITLHDDGS
ncbi:uncharacterized protein LOC135389926 [Ornithodoros turicata]|uniref:Brinker DNA-binding domain-containing protein n=1 Tax=Ornithodoros turicata TaxID=34597 RepID=A0A2R5LD74_9ACAR